VAHSSNTLLKRFLSVNGFDDKSLDHWGEVCEAYMQARLTNTSDRVVAFAGIAEECQQHFRDQYLAGLWRRDLERQLLWKTVNPYEATRPEPLHAPTWSFLCQDSPIEWHKRQMDSKKMARILAVDAQLEDDKYPFGSYTTCVLLLDAVTVIAGFIEPSTRPQQDNDNNDYILTKRRAPRSQQLRFISEDESFSIEDGSQFWLQLDLAWEFKGPFECVLVPLEVLITVDYCRPQIFGLVLYKAAGAGDAPVLGPLKRLGIFYARDQGACIVGQHETCHGIGFEFEGSEATGEAVDNRHGEHYIQMQQESFDAFMTGAYEKTIVLT
jgi:hypothetical protein